MTITGQYINIVDDLFDIFIIFPEWWDDLTVEEVTEVEERVEKCKEEWEFYQTGSYSALDAKNLLAEELQEEEFQILVFDHRDRGVKQNDNNV